MGLNWQRAVVREWEEAALWAEACKHARTRNGLRAVNSCCNVQQKLHGGVSGAANVAVTPRYLLQCGKRVRGPSSGWLLLIYVCSNESMGMVSCIIRSTTPGSVSSGGSAAPQYSP